MFDQGAKELIHNVHTSLNQTWVVRTSWKRVHCSVLCSCRSGDCTWDGYCRFQAADQRGRGR